MVFRATLIQTLEFPYTSLDSHSQDHRKAGQYWQDHQFTQNAEYWSGISISEQLTAFVRGPEGRRRGISIPLIVLMFVCPWKSTTTEFRSWPIQPLQEDASYPQVPPWSPSTRKARPLRQASESRQPPWFGAPACKPIR